MPFASWWRGDPLPGLPQTPELAVQRVTRWDEARQITGLTEQRVVARYEDSNALYAAFLDEQPAGYGWLLGRPAASMSCGWSSSCRAPSCTSGTS